MATRLLFPVGWLIALVAFAGCGNGSNGAKDMATGGGDLAGVDASMGPAVGGTVTGLAGTGLVLQNNGGDDLTVSTSGAFAFATPVADGAGYDVTIAAQPTTPPQLCAVSNGKGTITGGMSVSSVAVRCAPVVRFVLVVDKLDGSVDTFALDAGSGRLRYAGKSATGPQPISIATDPDGKFAYVGNAGDHTVSQYAIDGNGVLSALSPATVAAGTLAPLAIAVDPAGAHAYVVTSGGVLQYAVGSDGKLSALSPAMVSAGGGAAAMVVEPSGRFAYVANAGDSTVSQFSVGADGTLTPLGTATVATGMVPMGVTADPTGRFVYVTNAGDKTVSQYSIGSDGALAPLSTPTVAAGTNALSPVVDPTGKYAFLLNPADKTISQYSIGSDGTLTPAAGTAPVGNGADAVIVDGSGKFAWVVNDADGTVGQYTVGSGGTLAANAPATLKGQKAPTALALVGGHGPALPTAAHAYVTDRTGSVHDYPVGADGTLQTPTTINTGGNPQGIVLDPSGTHAYVLDTPFAPGTAHVLQYAIAANGTWTALTPPSVTAGDEPGAIAIDPTGHFVYVVNSDGTMNLILQYAVGADGTLAPLSTPSVTTLTEPVGIAVDPSGRFAYAVTDTVIAYAIAADGSLTNPMNATVPMTANPQSVAIDPSGRFAYATNAAAGTVLQFSIDATDGHLTALAPASVSAGAAAQTIALDPFGRFGYVVNTNACTVSQYAVGATGPLAALSPATVGAGDCGAAMDGVTFVAVDPSGRFAYVPDVGTSSSSVLQYAVGATGALAPLSPAATGALASAQLERIAFLLRFQ